MGTEHRSSKSFGCLMLVCWNRGRLARKVNVFSFAALLIASCSSPSKPNEPLTAEEQAILNVGLAYRDASRALQRGPASTKELQPYLKKYGDPEKLLTSPNDGRPYQLVWGRIPYRPMKNTLTNRFLIYEQTGKAGKRFALDFMLKVYHLSDEEFNRLRGSS